MLTHAAAHPLPQNIRCRGRDSRSSTAGSARQGRAMAGTLSAFGASGLLASIPWGRARQRPRLVCGLAGRQLMRFRRRRPAHVQWRPVAAISIYKIDTRHSLGSR